MGRSALRTSSRSRVTSGRLTRRTTRFALRCDPLERRQLLSVGQTAAAATVLASHSVPSDVVPSPATPTAAVSGDSSSAANSASLGARDNAQDGFLLSEFSLQSPDPGTVAALAALSAIPAANGQGVNLADANLSVSVLNPVDTSVAAAIADTQVDADAFLVPSTTEQLEGFLGVPTASASHAGFLFSDLLGAGNSPDVTTTNGPVISNTNAPGPSVVSPAHNAGSHIGQALVREVLVSEQNTSQGDELIGAGGPFEPPQAQPAAPGDRSPAPAAAPQPAGPEGQAPAPAAAPQPAGPEGQAPAPPAKPDPDQPGGQAGAPASGQASALPATRASDIDAALDLIDVGDLTRSRAGDTSPAARADTSRSFSVLFGVAVVASGGQQLAMRAAARSRSYGRAVPRSLGAERPTREKAAAPC
jgi:hypothetical protein